MSTGQGQHSIKDSLQTTKQTLQLCFLQMSQAIPIAAGRILYLILQVGVTTELIFDDNKRVILYYAYLYRYLWISYDILRIFEHNTHFYLYFIFSESFRKAFIKRFLSSWSTVRKTNVVVVSIKSNTQ